MKRFSQYLFDLSTMNVFGVCTYVGHKLGIGADKVRKYFIYASFATLGSPLIVYLLLSFLLEFRRMSRRRSVWDL